jgi:2-methylcitrate dehydratase PrpD
MDCRLAHPGAVGRSALLLQRHRFQAAQVREVIVRVATPEAAVVNDRDLPDICLQHMIAVMLVDGTVTFVLAHDKGRMDDSIVLKKRAKVRLVPGESQTARLPSREAIVEVTLTDGSQFTEHVEAVRGTS